MNKLYKLLLNIILVILISFDPIEASCFGCVELDELTFNKIIKKFEYSLIKFDIAFPYGEKHEAFGDFSKSIGSKINELLIGLVGVKDYGDKDNLILAQRFNIDETKFPVILLFKNHSTENWTKFPIKKEINPENLKEFVKKHTNLYIGLDGCLEEFDNVVEGFLDKSDYEKEEIYLLTKKLSDSYNNQKDKEKSKLYLVYMKKIMEKGSVFVEEEQHRIENLLKGKIRENKKIELKLKLNILQSFSRRNDDENDDENDDDSIKDEL